MNGIHALLPPTLDKSTDVVLSSKSFAKKYVQGVSAKQILFSAYISIVGLIFALAIDVHITALVAAFFLSGFWASHRLSSKGAITVAVALVFLNLIAWREAYLALPIAGLTIAIAQRLAVKQSRRDLLKLSGVVGACLSVLYVFGREILQSVATF